MRRIQTILLCSAVALGQNSQESSHKSEQGPPIKVNILNVCTPNTDEQRELKSALTRLPKDPSFSADYEISRGVSTVEAGKSARYVRLRREFKNDSPLSTIQYSLSSDSENTIETLVFRPRDVKELLAFSIEDKVSATASTPSAVIQSDTPASRLRIERPGKASVGLARCPEVDQSQYQPIFAQASAALADYRRLLKLRTMLASDISWLSSSTPNASSPTQGKATGGRKSSAPPK